MTWYQYLLGWLVTNSWLALVLGVVACGLWAQGWLAGRKYYNRARPDPWGTLHGMLWIGLLRSPKGEDRAVQIHPDSDDLFETPWGEVIGPSTPGRISDGESSPPITWPLTGGPFNGRARDAALGPHDELCGQNPKTMPSDKAHGVMYCLMRSRGLWWRGPIKHAVLLNWGSKW